MIDWNPSLQALSRGGNKLLFIFSSFIKLAALKELDQKLGLRSGLNIIVRWRPEDIVSGVSDLDVFEFSKQKGIKLFRNRDLHSKLFVYENNKAFLTSGNLTGRGLGEQENRNLEVGTFVDFLPSDWNKAYEIIENSMEVTEEMVAWLQEHALPGSTIDSIPPEPDWEKDESFAISDFPATQSPHEFFEFYQAEEGSLTPSQRSSLEQDRSTFKVPSGLSKDQLWKRLEISLRSQKYVKHILQWVERESSLRFGELARWAHNNCHDRPVPYRKDVKTYLNHLYDWMEELLHEVSWHVPGQRSQILKWNKN